MSHSIASWPDTLAAPEPMTGKSAPTSVASDGRRGTAESDSDLGGDECTLAVLMLIVGIPSSSASQGEMDGRRPSDC